MITAKTHRASLRDISCQKPKTGKDYKNPKGLKIPAGAPWALATDARTLWVAIDNTLRIIPVTLREGELAPGREKRIKMPCEVTRLLARPNGGVLACVSEQDAVTLHLIEGDDPRQIATLKNCHDLAVTGKTIVTVEETDHAVSVVMRELRRGTVLRHVPVESDRVRLRQGSGDNVAVIEGGGRLRILNAARRADSCRDPGRGSDPQRPDPGTPGGDTSGDSGCGCGCGCGCKCNEPKYTIGTDTFDPDASRVPPRRDPDGRCVPGDDGIPEGCWVTIRRGALLIRINICDPSIPPCAIQLNYAVGRLARAGNMLIARSADGRRATVLDGRSLATLRSLTLAASAEIQAFGRDGDFALLDPEEGLSVVTAIPEAALNDTLAVPPTTSAVYDGESPISLYSASGPFIGLRTVMIVPVLEPGQQFTGTTENIASFFEMEDILERVQDYFVEASYDDPPNHYGANVHFIWFGADTPTIYEGMPVRLDTPLKEYWGPAWDPGHVRATVTPPASGIMVSFSGDETMRLRCKPETDSFEELDFDLRFPSGSYRGRIPDGISAITYEAAMTPRSITLDGTDRQGNSFSFTVDTGVLTGTRQVNLARTVLGSGAAALSQTLGDLADVLEEMLEAGAPGLFERPSVVWQDDADEGGILHVSISFADAPGGMTPVLSTCDIADLFDETGGGSMASVFSLPGDEDSLTTLLRRVVIDAHVAHPEFGPDMSESYFDFDEKWQPTVTLEGGDIETRISLSTRHGRDPAIIELLDQVGLDPLGFDAPVAQKGADTSFSGGGGPKFEDNSLFDDVYTKMIDASIAYRGNEETAIDAINFRFNCIGQEDFDYECAFDMIHSVVITPVYPGTGILGAETEPDLVLGERGAARSVSMDDSKSDERTKFVHPIGWSRGKIVMKLATSSVDETDRPDRSVGTLAHELGHTLMDLRDLYGGGTFRNEVQYMGNNCLMGDSGSMSHFCAYHKRIRGWLEDDAILLFDRPDADNSIDTEIILIQLEYWDPTFEPASWDIIAQTALPGAAPNTPVVASAFLRLGGDGRQFDILELRGQGPRFSQELTDPRIVISNAIDPLDETRYSEEEIENSGTTEDTAERYRRPVHRLSSSLRAATVGTADDTFDFASDPTFPEVGLSVQVLEWGMASGSAGTFNLARVRIRWDRGDAINLGFRDSTPDWQSPDIAIIRPEDLPPDGSDPDFPDSQDDLEGFRVPPSGSNPLMHKVGVRVWNFGDAQAQNVQVGLVRRETDGGGGGDWDDVEDFFQNLPDPLDAGDSQVVFFDWEVPPDSPEHLCWRAEIGDRDVPRDANGNALASDDTDASNDWAQQNVFEMEAISNSPPAPVFFTFEVNNTGSYTEEVRVAPEDLLTGATVNVSPARMKIAPRSRGLFRIKAVLEERLLTARCGKDIDFRLVAYRTEDHNEEPWGSARYRIKPRLATEIELNGSVLPTSMHLWGQVTPDVGAQNVLLQIDRPGEPTLWQRITMGPNATYDFELEGNFEPDTIFTAVAYYEGSFEYAKSVSPRDEMYWIVQG